MPGAWRATSAAHRSGANSTRLGERRHFLHGPRRELHSVNAAAFQRAAFRECTGVTHYACLPPQPIHRCPHACTCKCMGRGRCACPHACPISSRALCARPFAPAGWHQPPPAPTRGWCALRSPCPLQLLRPAAAARPSCCMPPSAAHFSHHNLPWSRRSNGARSAPATEKSRGRAGARTAVQWCRGAGARCEAHEACRLLSAASLPIKQALLDPAAAPTTALAVSRTGCAPRTSHNTVSADLQRSRETRQRAQLM